MALRPKSLWVDMGSNDGQGCSNQEEEYMQNFVRNHMTSILFPLAEHVREIQAQLEAVTRDFAVAEDARADQKQKLSDQVYKELTDLANGLQQTNARLEKAELAIAPPEPDQQEAVQDNTHVDLKKAVADIRALERKVTDMQGSSQELDDKFQALQLSSTKTGKQVVEHGETLNQLNDLYKCLSYRLVDIDKDVGNSAKLHKRNERSIASFHASYEQQKEEDQKQFARLNDEWISFDDRLGDTNRNLQREADRLISSQQDIQALKKAVDSERTSAVKLEALQKRLLEVVASVKAQSEQLVKVDEEVDRFKKDHLAEKRTMTDLIQELCRQASTHASDIHLLEETQVKQGDMMKKTDRCLTDFHVQFTDLKSLAEQTNKEVLAIGVWQKDSTAKMGSQRAAVQKAQADAQQAFKEVDAVNIQLNALRDDLGNVNGTLAQLSSNYDFCSKNMQGLSKGLQETYRHVVMGERGMLAPRNSLTASPGRLRPSTGGTRTPGSARPFSPASG